MNNRPDPGDRRRRSRHLAEGRTSKRLIAFAVVATFVFSLMTATFSSASASAPTGPSFPAMNTAETQPPGIWYRNSPHTDDPIRITGFGAYDGETLTEDCYGWGDPVGQYSNTLWYYSHNLTRSVVDGRSNEGWMNAHYINDGLNANQITSGVPACNGNQPPAPAPAPSPTVTLAQGLSGPLGYWYAVSVSGFGGNAPVSISCYDTVSGNFYTDHFTTTAAGNGSWSDHTCYDADGPDHWVVVNGVESNHVQWGAGSSTGGGSTPTPTPTPPTTGGTSGPGKPTAALPDMRYTMFPIPKQKVNWLAYTPYVLGIKVGYQSAVEALRAVGWTNAYNAGKHYSSASGTPLQLNMADLVNSQSPLYAKLNFYLQDRAGKAVAAAMQTPSNQSSTVQFTTEGPISDRAWVTSQAWENYRIDSYIDYKEMIHSFKYQLNGDVWISAADSAGHRQIQIRYHSTMFDVYDFDPDTSHLGQVEVLAYAGLAADFYIEGATSTVTLNGDAANFTSSKLQFSPVGAGGGGGGSGW